MVAIAEARPPYVTFELRAVEDREASIAAGHFVAKDVAYAIITPQGSKDRIERVAAEWFSQLEQQSREDRFPSEWLRAFKAAFKDWQEGHEPAVNGTDVRNWPAASPAQVKALLDVKVRTVEDLAAANEETIGRLAQRLWSKPTAPRGAAPRCCRFRAVMAGSSAPTCPVRVLQSARQSLPSTPRPLS